MLSRSVIEEAEHLGKQLGMGSGQPCLRLDHGAESLFEILKGNIVNWGSYPQRILVPGVAEPMKPPILAIVGYPPESHCRNAQPRFGLDHRF